MVAEGPSIHSLEGILDAAKKPKQKLRAGEEADDRGQDGWMASLTQRVGLSKLRETEKDREAWCAAVHGAAKSQTRLSEQQQTQTAMLQAKMLCSATSSEQARY